MFYISANNIIQFIFLIGITFKIISFNLNLVYYLNKESSI